MCSCIKSNLCSKNVGFLPAEAWFSAPSAAESIQRTQKEKRLCGSENSFENALKNTKLVEHRMHSIAVIWLKLIAREQQCVKITSRSIHSVWTTLFRTAVGPKQLKSRLGQFDNRQNKKSVKKFPSQIYWDSLLAPASSTSSREICEMPMHSNKKSINRATHTKHGKRKNYWIVQKTKFKTIKTKKGQETLNAYL